MNHNEEVPDFCGGLGDMLPADVLKVLNELLELLHRKDKDYQGSHFQFVYVAPGAQHVDTVQNQYLYPAPSPAPYRGGENVMDGKPAHGWESTVGGKPAPFDGHPFPSDARLPVAFAPNRGGELPEALATDKAMALWRKAQRAGYVDEHYQPLLSRTQAALLADAMAERLGIKEKWKVFGDLWKRNNMRSDYTRAMNQRQSLSFQDKLKRLFFTDNEENTGKT